MPISKKYLGTVDFPSVKKTHQDAGNVHMHSNMLRCFRCSWDAEQLGRELHCGLSSSLLPPTFFPSLLESVIPDLWV